MTQCFNIHVKIEHHFYKMKLKKNLNQKKRPKKK